MKQSLVLLALTILVASCTQKEPDPLVRIEGKVSSLKATKVIFEYIVDNPITGLGETYTADIDSNSCFSMEIPVERLATGRITAGRYYHEVCFLPGDELFIEINADTLHYSGKGSGKNNFLYEAEINEVHNRAFYSEYNKGEMAPDEFLDAMDKFRQKRLDFLDSYLTENELDPVFTDNFRIETQVIFDRLIQGYPRRYSNANKISEDSLNLPSEYQKFSYLSYLTGDEKVISFNYLHNIRNFLYTKSKEARKADSTLTSIGAIHTVIFDSLNRKTREYVMAKWLCSEFSSDKLDTMTYERFQEIEKDSLSARTVWNAHEKYLEKRALIGQSLHPAFTETMLVDSTENQLSFGEMMNGFKGKVVYLDLWGLNCGPCVAAMPHSKQLKERLDSYPIEFVYIAQDPPGKNTWKRIFDISLTKENHFRMVDHRWGSSKMLKFMEINWVPCYMIFNRQGELVDFNADRPYVREGSESRLEITLKELADE